MAEAETVQEIRRSVRRMPVKSGSSHKQSLCSRSICCAKANAVLNAAISAPNRIAVSAASSPVAVQKIFKWRT